MRKFILLIFVILIYFSTSSISYACEPCGHKYSFQESLEEADLVILGQKIGEGSRSDFGEGYGGPDWIEVKIERIIVGDTPKDVIKVNSWNAMCSYGIILNDNRTHVMFLREKKSTQEDYAYDAVYNGCGIKSFPVVEGKVFLEDEEISFGQFMQKILDAGFVCFDLHGDNKCKPKKTKEDREREHQKILAQEKFTTQFECQQDDDCHPTKSGGCITGNVLSELLKSQPDIGETTIKCRCLNGPVEYGCVPVDN